MRRVVLANLQLLALIGFGLALFVHPLIHNTPLDSGALDAFFMQVHLFSAGVLSSK